MMEESSDRSLPRNVWVLTLVSFLTDVSSDMVSNLLPIFLASVLGARTGVIGLIEGVAETTASLLKMVSGELSDRLGRRKPLVVLGYSLSTVAKPFLYLATSWGWVLGVRFADRAGKGLRTAPRDALMADSVATPRRGLAFGVQRAGDTAGAMVGIGVALAFLLTWPGSGDLDRPRFQAIVLWSLLPAAAAVVALVLGAKERHQPRAKPGMTPTPFRRLDSRFRFFLFIIVLFTLGNSSDAFLILRARSVGLSVTGVLGMLLVFNLIYALLSGPAGALSDRLGRRRLLTAGWSVYALVYLGFAWVGSAWQAWVLMAVYGVYYALTEGVGRAFVADLVPAEAHGAAFGAYHAAIGLAALPASLMAGLLWQGVGAWRGFGPAAPFLVGGVLALAAILLLTRVAQPSA
jgi:MFS family permease